MTWALVLLRCSANLVYDSTSAHVQVEGRYHVSSGEADRGGGVVAVAAVL